MPEFSQAWRHIVSRPRRDRTFRGIGGCGRSTKPHEGRGRPFRFFKANFRESLFGAGGVLLLMALSFAANYYTHQADRISQLVQAMLAVSDRLREVEVADRLDKAFLKSFAAVERATSVDSEHLKNAKSLPRLDAAVQEQGRSTSRLARGEVAYAVGVVDKTELNDERLAKYVAGFKRQLQDYDVQLATMEGFFVANQAGDGRRRSVQDRDG